MIDLGDLPCAARALALEEPLGGTAPAERGALVVEQPGPWGRDAVSESGLRPVHAELEAKAAEAGLKLLVVRRQTRRYAVDAGRTVLVAGFEPGARFLEHHVAADLDALLALDLERGAGPSHPGPVALACTHSTRDACCAQLGLPLARDLLATGVETWHCSHLGGHRFAPTMAVLPHGLWLGRVGPDAVEDVVAAVREDRIPLAHLRGRAGLPPAAQVAEIAVRERTGADGLDDVAVSEVVSDGVATEVRLHVRGGAAWAATVVHEPTGTVRALSCGADPKREDPGRWRAKVAPVDADPAPRLEA